MKYIVFFVLVFFLIGILVIPQSLAQGIVPAWIKNNAEWWANGEIDDFTFAQGIGFLIKNKIIQIDDLPTTPTGDIIIEENIMLLPPLDKIVLSLFITEHLNQQMEELQLILPCFLA